jgi:fused signal recognition particle receptor
MFKKLKEGLSGLVNKVATTELKAEQLHPTLQGFKLSLIENDVAVSVADHICSEMEKRLDGVQVKRLEDKQEIVKKNLREVLREILTANEKIDLLELAQEKQRINQPLVIVFVGINGTGKTTSIAKVAKLLTKNGYSVVLACSDTYRGAATPIGQALLNS